MEDIEHGRRDGSKITHVDSEGILCLKWPDAFKGYGLENKTILDELGRRNWLVVDPMAPFRKVAELQVGIGAPWKILRLHAMDLSVLTGFSHEAWSLGDYVLVEDKELGISVTTRIVRREYNLQEPWNTVLELSTTLKNLGSSVERLWGRRS